MAKNFKLFTSDGTWVAPAGVTVARMSGVGAGGGGGSSCRGDTNSGNPVGSGGGGGGGLGGSILVTDVVPGRTYTAHVGAGGPGAVGNSGNPATDGGDSYVDSSGGTSAYFRGGQGGRSGIAGIGVNNAVWPGGAFGNGHNTSTPTDPSLTVQPTVAPRSGGWGGGQTGGNATYRIGQPSVLSGNGGGSAGSDSTANSVGGGGGGAGEWQGSIGGSGGNASATGTPTNGAAGTLGGGGGGAGGTGTAGTHAADGGTGGNGAILIEWDA